jgi:hypothetical protein
MQFRDRKEENTNNSTISNKQNEYVMEFQKNAAIFAKYLPKVHI